MIQCSSRVLVGRENAGRMEMKTSSDAQPISWRHDAADRQDWRAPADITVPSFHEGDEQAEEYERWDGLA